MNPPNVAALGLLVVTLGFLLFGLLFATAPHLKSSMTTNGQMSVFVEDDLPPSYKPIVKMIPWAASGFIFLMFAVPAFFLALSGFSIWHFIGRRRIAQKEREAFLQKSRESALQMFIDEIIGKLFESDRSLREIIYEGMVKVLPQLDLSRRNRFYLFLREGRFDTGGLPILPLDSPVSSPPFRHARGLARAAAFVLFLVSCLMILWGFLMLLPGLTSVPDRPIHGIQLDQTGAVLSAFFCFILGVMPLAFGLGLLLLSHIEWKLQEKWSQGRSEAQGHLLRSYHEQMGKLSRSSPSAECATWDLRSIARGLTRCILGELDGAGKRAVLELLHELGYIREDPSLLAPSFADFSGVDLSGIVLRGARLREINFNAAILCDADLAGADLTGACFSGADLRRSELSGTCLCGADLRFSKLHQARLSRADLRSAHLVGANLWQADFSGANLTSTQFGVGQLAPAGCLEDPSTWDGR